MNSSPTKTVGQVVATLYLTLVGFIYFATGFFGLKVSGQGVAAILYDLVTVPPFPLFDLLRRCVETHPCSIYGIPYQPFPLAFEDWLTLSRISMLLGVIAIMAAGLMLAGKRIGYVLWLSLITLAIVATGWNIFEDLKNVLRPGSAARFMGMSPIAVFWSASYVLAYVVLRQGLKRARKDNVTLKGSAV